MIMKFLKGAVFGVILGTIGGYLFNSQTGKQNREKVKVVAERVMGRLLDEIKNMESVTKRDYSAIIKRVIAEFKEDKTLSKEAWDEVAKELKGRWKNLSSEISAKKTEDGEV
jgi:gas vesicle protein